MSETRDGTIVERLARAIAEQLGDSLDRAFESKSDWIAARGQGSDGRPRDINMPFRVDYLDAARAALEALREPTPAMISAGLDERDVSGAGRRGLPMVFSAMISAALSEEG